MIIDFLPTKICVLLNGYLSNQHQTLTSYYDHTMLGVTRSCVKFQRWMQRTLKDEADKKCPSKFDLFVCFYSPLLSHDLSQLCVIADNRSVPLLSILNLIC